MHCCSTPTTPAHQGFPTRMVYLLYIMLEIHHSGRDPSIYIHVVTRNPDLRTVTATTQRFSHTNKQILSEQLSCPFTVQGGARPGCLLNTQPELLQVTVSFSVASCRSQFFGLPSDSEWWDQLMAHRLNGEMDTLQFSKSRILIIIIAMLLLLLLLLLLLFLVVLPPLLLLSTSSSVSWNISLSTYGIICRQGTVFGQVLQIIEVEATDPIAGPELNDILSQHKHFLSQHKHKHFLSQHKQ